jgi:hypothetical protein
VKRRLRLVDSREGGLLGRKGGEAEGVAFVLAFFLVCSPESRECLVCFF